MEYNLFHIKFDNFFVVLEKKEKKKEKNNENDDLKFGLSLFALDDDKFILFSNPNGRFLIIYKEGKKYYIDNDFNIKSEQVINTTFSINNREYKIGDKYICPDIKNNTLIFSKKNFESSSEIANFYYYVVVEGEIYNLFDYKSFIDILDPVMKSYLMKILKDISITPEKICNFIMFKELILHGLDVNYKINGLSLLAISAISSNYNSYELLINKDANVNDVDDEGNSIICYLLKYDFVDDLFLHFPSVFNRIDFEHKNKNAQSIIEVLEQKNLPFFLFEYIKELVNNKKERSNTLSSLDQKAKGKKSKKNVSNSDSEKSEDSESDSESSASPRSERSEESEESEDSESDSESSTSSSSKESEESEESEYSESDSESSSSEKSEKSEKSRNEPESEYSESDSESSSSKKSEKSRYDSDSEESKDSEESEESESDSESDKSQRIKKSKNQINNKKKINKKSQRIKNNKEREEKREKDSDSDLNSESYSDDESDSKSHQKNTKNNSKSKPNIENDSDSDLNSKSKLKPNWKNNKNDSKSEPDSESESDSNSEQSKTR